MNWRFSSQSLCWTAAGYDRCYSWKLEPLERGKYCVELWSSPQQCLSWCLLLSSLSDQIRDGKWDRLKRLFKHFCHPSQASASESGSDTVFKSRTNESTNTVKRVSLLTDNRFSDSSGRNLWDSRAWKDIIRGQRENVADVDFVGFETKRPSLPTHCSSDDSENSTLKSELRGRQIVLREMKSRELEISLSILTLFMHCCHWRS